MKSTQLRSAFYQFFTERGHAVVPSSSLIPADDPTLLFANAGMNQFKSVFLGEEKRSYQRAVSIQKCIRAGGKHNDLDNVGFTARHLTFFEMMGNFSFGDYFKKEAILYAWEFLTKTIGLDATKISASVFEKDDEAYELWHRTIGLPQERIVRLGAKDNFWQMGDTGPCGPCTELYYDRGASWGCQQSSCAPGCDCGRFLEIWNLVFMQYNRQKDGTDLPLAQTGVDTGMGLDRLCSVVQDAPSVYETDLFMPIIARIEQLTGHQYAAAEPRIKAAFRVLADHIRSATCAIADGCTPAADGRGYVLRKIIRRAALFAQKLSHEQFFPQLVDGVIESLGAVYPDIVQRRETIIMILEQELAQFSRNLIRGTNLLERYFAEHGTTSPVSGTMAFTLYDTYGFPLELMEVLAHEQGTTLDHVGFAKEMERQRQQSEHRKEIVQFSLSSDIATQFTGYESLEETTTISALFTEAGTLTQSISAGTVCWIITPKSPFYVAGGGQVNDEGWIIVHDHNVPLEDLKKQGGAIACKITAPVNLKQGDTVTLRVNRAQRLSTMNNHTATHLLQSALMKVFGVEVKQAGSLVNPDYLRFDFSCSQQPTSTHIDAVEKIVNEQMRENIELNIRWTTLQDARDAGVIAFFGEKYNPDHVRIVTIPGFSSELCGGTHVRATGDIGMFKITEVAALSAGNRRIVAVTGQKALELFQQQSHSMKQLSSLFKVPEHEIVAAIEKQRALTKDLQHELSSCRKQLVEKLIPQWAHEARVIKGTPYHIIILENMTAEELRAAAEQLTAHRAGLWILIATNAENMNIAYVISVAPELAPTISLKQLLEQVKPLGMRGSCKNNLIQGGAPSLPEKLAATIEKWLQER
jgi:alanyl-tRNA synthetase